jgi:hypothetical protein
LSYQASKKIENGRKRALNNFLRIMISPVIAIITPLAALYGLLIDLEHARGIYTHLENLEFGRAPDAASTGHCLHDMARVSPGIKVTCSQFGADEDRCTNSLNPIAFKGGITLIPGSSYNPCKKEFGSSEDKKQMKQ